MAEIKWISGEHKGQTLEGTPDKTSKMEHFRVVFDDGRELGVMGLFTAGVDDAVKLKMSVAEGMLVTKFSSLVSVRPA